MNFENDILECLSVLRNGGLIVYPTDTVWGIGCDATDEKAVEKIYKVKKRPDHKAMIVLVADERNVLQHVAAPDFQVFDYLKETKKPTTVIYEGALGLAENLIAGDGSIAIRICRDEFCKQLLKRFRKPLVSTSANISGQPAAHSFEEITGEIKMAAGYVVKHRQDDKTIVEPSSVIKWKNGKVEILRP